MTLVSFTDRMFFYFNHDHVCLYQEVVGLYQADQILSIEINNSAVHSTLFMKKLLVEIAYLTISSNYSCFVS